jgi:hypothetical protein
MLRDEFTGPRVRTGFDIDRPQIAVVNVLQGHGHHFGFSVDTDMAEKLQAKTGREILALLRAAALLERFARIAIAIEQTFVESRRRVPAQLDSWRKVF